MSNLKPKYIRYKERAADGSNVYRLVVDTNNGASESEVRIGRRQLDDFGADVLPISGNLQELSSEQLRHAVLNFDKAGHIMMFEHGPIEADPPCRVPEPMRPVEMRLEPTERPDEFLAVVTCLCGSDTRIYNFKIATEIATAISWERQFFQDMGGSTQLATPLFDSIREFFEAGR